MPRSPQDWNGGSGASMRLPALPRLDSNEIRCLSAGLAVQKQSRDGLAGNGYVAIDMRASPEAVWSLLTDYAKYEERIPTVRASSVQPGATKDNCRATYVLSKFRLEVSVTQRFDDSRQKLSFFLDSKSRNLVMKEAAGFWHIETDAQGLKPGHVRVWLCASIRISRVVPRWVVDYAARRALPRATTWLRPAAEAKTRELELAQTQ